MAHKKGQGSTQNNRDSAGRRLGVKKYGGEKVVPGNIIIRQRGTKIHAGNGVGMGRDHTIFATIEGIVKFSNITRGRKRVSVIWQEKSINLNFIVCMRFKIHFFTCITIPLQTEALLILYWSTLLVNYPTAKDDWDFSYLVIKQV